MNPLLRQALLLRLGGPEMMRVANYDDAEPMPAPEAPPRGMTGLEIDVSPEANRRVVDWGDTTEPPPPPRGDQNLLPELDLSTWGAQRLGPHDDATSEADATRPKPQASGDAVEQPLSAPPLPPPQAMDRPQQDPDDELRLMLRRRMKQRMQESDDDLFPRLSYAFGLAAGNNPRPPPKPQETDQEVMSYLAARDKDAAKELQLGQKDRDLELKAQRNAAMEQYLNARAKLAEERANYESGRGEREESKESRRMALAERTLGDKEKLWEAQIGNYESMASTRRAKASAAANAAANSSEAVVFEGEEFAPVVHHPNKQVQTARAKEVDKEIKTWQKTVNYSKETEKALSDWGNSPSAKSYNALKTATVFMTQGLTAAIGGGAMQDAEFKRAADGLGIGTDVGHIKAWTEAQIAKLTGNKQAQAEAVAELTNRVKSLQKLARVGVEGVLRGAQYGPTGNKPKDTWAGRGEPAKADAPAGRRYGKRKDGSVVYTDDGTTWYDNQTGAKL